MTAKADGVLVWCTGRSPAEALGATVTARGECRWILVSRRDQYDSQYHLVELRFDEDYGEPLYRSHTLWPDGTGRQWPLHWRWTFIPESGQ